MAGIKTLVLNRKKFALLPIGEYKKLLTQIDDLKDLVEVKRRAKEPRVSFSEVKAAYLKNHK
jgi:hypothetical protein